MNKMEKAMEKVMDKIDNVVDKIDDVNVSVGNVGDLSKSITTMSIPMYKSPNTTFFEDIQRNVEASVFRLMLGVGVGVGVLAAAVGVGSAIAYNHYFLHKTPFFGRRSSTTDSVRHSESSDSDRKSCNSNDRNTNKSSGKCSAKVNRKPEHKSSSVGEEKKFSLVIEYCARCKWMHRAVWLSQEILSTFQDAVGSVTIKPNFTTGGIFEVNCNGVNIWSRKTEKAFPSAKALKQRVRDVTSPDTFLGHSDTQENQEKQQLQTEKERQI